jgi:S1-C subfamily serine protease
MVAALALLVAVPAVLVGQEEAPRARERDRYRVYTWNDNRGRIGVVVSTEANATTDRLGARIEGVTPGAPAARAGIKAGDVITKFNGTALAGAPADVGEESGPGMKLLELARALEPGDTVRLEYRRGTETKTATIVAEDLGGDAFTMVAPKVRVGPMPDMRMFIPEMDELRGEFEWSTGGMHSPWSGLEFVSVERDLGEYFGVTEGLLVVKARADSAMPLRAGDVILAIDGRKPTSPSHALRILRSYEVGESVKLDIQRKQRRQTVTWTVPEREQTYWRTPRPARPPRPPQERSEES